MAARSSGQVRVRAKEGRTNEGTIEREGQNRPDVSPGGQTSQVYRFRVL